MKCLKCGKEIIDENAKFCPECGVKLPKKEKKCPSCGNILNYDDKYCNKCGASLDDSDIFLVEDKNEKKDDNSVSSSTKAVSIIGFILAFVPASILMTRVGALVLSIIALVKISKEEQRNPKVDIKTYKVLSIIGVVISSITILAIIVGYALLFILLGFGTFESLIDQIPEFFL